MKSSNKYLILMGFWMVMIIPSVYLLRSSVVNEDAVGCVIGIIFLIASGYFIAVHHEKYVLETKMSERVVIEG